MDRLTAFENMLSDIQRQFEYEKEQMESGNNIVRWCNTR